jgi:hypothetical protein
MDVYFYCLPTGPPEAAAYQHASVCLAEGLRELGIGVHGNVPYWQAAPDEPYLIGADGAAPEDCDVVVINHCWFDYGQPRPEKLYDSRRRFKTVFLDASDGFRTASWTDECRAFDLILRAHYNARDKNPSNMQPWAFGLTNRIIQATAPRGEQRDNAIVWNSRVAHGLLRGVVVPAALPVNRTVEAFDDVPAEGADQLLWHQTGRRHQPNFYKRLRSSASAMCVSGFIQPRTTRPLLRRFDIGRGRLAQWDSWRLWEALAAACVPVHIRLDGAGAALPVPLVAGRHYIPSDEMAYLMDDGDEVRRIGDRGRAFALEHYGPVPVARRFLRYFA